MRGVSSEQTKGVVAGGAEGISIERDEDVAVPEGTVYLVAA